MSDQRRNTFRTPRTTFRQRASKRLRDMAYAEAVAQTSDVPEQRHGDPAFADDHAPGGDGQRGVPPISPDKSAIETML